MRPLTTIALVVVAVIAIAGGWYFGARPAQPGMTEIALGRLVFPNLAGVLQDTARVEIKHQDTTLVIARQGDTWVLPDRGGYPVQQSKMHEMLTAMTELRITEPRTSDPTEYSRLGVEDPAGTSSTSNLVRLLDASGKPIAELIVGHRRVRTQGNVPEDVYIRLPGASQSWLAEGNLEVDADPQIWIDRDITNVDSAKIASVSVTRDGGQLDFARDGEKLVLKAPADHPKLDDYKVEDVGRAFENLTLTDVKPAAQEPGTQIGTSLFTTADGEKISVTGFKAGTAEKPEFWAQFSVAGDGTAKDAADKLEAKVKGWAFQLGTWKEAALVPAMADLKSSEPAPAAAPTPAPAATVPPAAATPAPAAPAAPAAAVTPTPAPNK
jgi:hypothetical protein